MKSQTALHIANHLGDTFDQMKTNLGSFLARCTEDKELQKILKTEATLKVQEMFSSEELEGLAEELEVEELEVISTQVMSFQVFPETILIHWCADAVEPGTPWEVQTDITAHGSLVEGVDAEKLIHLTGVTGLDTVNNQSYTTIGNLSCIRKVDYENEDGPTTTSLLPFNKTAEHMSLPLKLTVEKEYAGIPKGTELTLDSESMIYRDQDGGSGGVPADFILHVFFHSNPSSELGQAFSADDFSAGVPFVGEYFEEEDTDPGAEPTEAEALGGFLSQTQGQPEDEEIADDLIDEILKRKKKDE